MHAPHEFRRPARLTQSEAMALGLGLRALAADADVDSAVDATMLAKFRNGGQACTAANRIYVHAAVADRFFAGEQALGRRILEHLGAA
mgnify:CR=1 FL=1